MVCPKCGDVVYSGAVFCVRCGAMLAGTRPQEPDAPPAGAPNPWVKVGAGLFVVAAAIAVLATFSLGRSGGASVRYVPNVVGMARADAEAKLVKAGFVCVIGEERLSNTTEAGAVIAQSPGPDTPTSRRRVTLVVSTGPEVKQPEVVRPARQRAATAPRPSTAASPSTDATAKSERPAQPRQVATSGPKAKRSAPVSSAAAPEISRERGYGYVAVEAQPGDWEVWVYVDDGPARGKCPITVRLPAGEHSLVLWEPSRQRKVAVPVAVEADQTVSICKDLEENV